MVNSGLRAHVDVRVDCLGEVLWSESYLSWPPKAAELAEWYRIWQLRVEPSSVPILSQFYFSKQPYDLETILDKKG